MIFLIKTYFIYLISGPHGVFRVEKNIIIWWIWEKKKNLKIIGLNYKDKKKNAKDFLNELKNPYDLIISDIDGTIAIDWGAYGVPETYIIYNRKIIDKIIGPINDNTLKKIYKIIKWN